MPRGRPCPDDLDTCDEHQRDAVPAPDGVRLPGEAHDRGRRRQPALRRRSGVGADALERRVRRCGGCVAGRRLRRRGRARWRRCSGERPGTLRGEPECCRRAVRRSGSAARVTELEDDHRCAAVRAVRWPRGGGCAGVRPIRWPRVGKRAAVRAVRWARVGATVRPVRWPRVGGCAAVRGVRWARVGVQATGGPRVHVAVGVRRTRRVLAGGTAGERRQLAGTLAASGPSGGRHGMPAGRDDAVLRRGAA
jgi:hypothetical protein